MKTRPISPSMLRVLREAAAGTLRYVGPFDYRDAAGSHVFRQVYALRRHGLMLPAGYGPNAVTAAGRMALESAP